MACDLGLAPLQALGDDRRLEVVADGLPLLHGPQEGVDGVATAPRWLFVNATRGKSTDQPSEELGVGRRGHTLTYRVDLVVNALSYWLVRWRAAGRSRTRTKQARLERR